MQNGGGTRGEKWHKTDTGSSPSVRAGPHEAQTKTAAQAGTLNGGKGIEKHSSAFEENGYHKGSDAATRAALWYAENRASCPRPIIPFLRAEFGLSALETIAAIRMANGGAR